MGKKAKKDSKEGYTRIEAFASAIKAKKEGKVKALISQANQKYVAKGGKDNPKEATTVVNTGLKVLVAMGLAVIEGENYKVL